MQIEFINGGNFHHVGFIPEFLVENDPRPAKEQFNERYLHGGGWSNFGQGKWKLLEDRSIQYPQDPAYKPRAHIKFRDEDIYIYDHGWVSIVQPDGSFEVSRMD